jgi:hypothetical protein
MFRSTKCQILVVGTGGTSASTDHVFVFKKMILVEIYTKEFTNIEYIYISTKIKT